MPANRTATTG